MSEDWCFSKSLPQAVKTSLAAEVRNLRSPESLLLLLFVQLFDLADFLDASDRPRPLLPTTSPSSTLEADAMDDSVVFNMAVSGAAILLKPLMKCR